MVLIPAWVVALLAGLVPIVGLWGYGFGWHWRGQFEQSQAVSAPRCCACGRGGGQ